MFLTPNFFWVSPNNCIREDVKLSVINNFLLFSFLLFIKISFITAWRTNLTIIGQVLSFLFGFPNVWLLFRSSSLISTPSSSENAFIRISLVFSSLLSLTPCKIRQFCCEYSFKSSMSEKRLLCFSTKFSMVFSNWLIFSSVFLIPFSRSSNFADVSSSDSVLLIWDSFAYSWKVKSSF